MTGAELAECRCAAYDANHDGRISREEFLAGAGVVRGGARPAARAPAATPNAPAPGGGRRRNAAVGRYECRSYSGTNSVIPGGRLPRCGRRLPHRRQTRGPLRLQSRRAADRLAERLLQGRIRPRHPVAARVQHGLSGRRHVAMPAKVNDRRAPSSANRTTESSAATGSASPATRPARGRPARLVSRAAGRASPSPRRLRACRGHDRPSVASRRRWPSRPARTRDSLPLPDAKSIRPPRRGAPDALPARADPAAAPRPPAVTARATRGRPTARTRAAAANTTARRFARARSADPARAARGRTSPQPSVLGRALAPVSVLDRTCTTSCRDEARGAIVDGTRQDHDAGATTAMTGPRRAARARPQARGSPAAPHMADVARDAGLSARGHAPRQTLDHFLLFHPVWT